MTIVVIGLLLIATLVYAGWAYSHPVPHKRGLGLEQRLEFLDRALAHHRYVCRNGGARSKRWHCKAVVWTKREWREARHRWEHAWQLWLPDKWQRVGACETGYGRRPGNWSHANGSYVSAFGISRREYDNDAAYRGVRGWEPRKGQSGPPTPWEQYQAAVGHYLRFGGFSGWGCRGA